MSTSELEELYQDIIIDHYKHPRCHGICEHYSTETTSFNPLCGDKLQLSLVFDEDRVKELGFVAQGCSISQASASMMCELCKNKTPKEIRDLKSIFENMILKEENPSDSLLAQLGDSKVLRSIHKFPARYRCALLAWSGLEECLQKISR